MEELRHKKVISATLTLLKVVNVIENRVVALKLGKGIDNLLDSYLNFHTSSKTKEGTASVAQYYDGKNLIRSIDQILDTIEMLPELNPGALSPVIFLSAIKKLLILRLEIVRLVSAKKEKKESHNLISKNNLPEQKIRQENASVLNENKRKILDFVKKNPNTRTKDIIDNFDHVSGRTVKRNLSELLGEGLINRKAESGAVYYF